MNDFPPYIWPLISLFTSGLGGWIGVKISVTRLETQMDRVIEDVSKNTREIAQHSDDLLAHDMELEQALDQLKLKRARRQPLRGWDIK